jgi:hypothetical protein
MFHPPEARDCRRRIVKGERMDLSEVFVAQVRGLQAIYAEAHAALLNWGAWSLDRRGIFPTMSPPGWAQQYRASEGEEWGEEQATKAVEAPVKAEAPDRPPYNEKAAIELDERLHAPGGPNTEQRRAIKIAYCSMDIPEYQFPSLSGCTSQDAYRERLEACLVFVARFS